MLEFSFCTFSLKPVYVNPNVAKVGGLQSQDAKGEAVPTPGLRALGNAGSGVLRLSRRVKKIEKMT